MKRLAAVALMTGLMIGSVSGFPLDIQAEDRVNDLKKPATFEIKIENTLNTNKTFKVSVDNVKESWWFYDNSFKEIRPGETATLDFNVNATSRSISGRKDFEVQVKTNTGERNTTSSYFILEKETDIFFSNFNLEREKESIRVNSEIHNTANETLEHVVVELDGPETINEERNVSIASGERKQFSARLSEPESPGTYSVKLRAEGGSSSKETLNIEESSKDRNNKKKGVKVQKTWNRKLMTSTLQITAENTGNSPDQTTVEQKIPVFLAPITNFSPSPDSSRIKGGEKYIVWNINLQAGEKAQVSYRTSYKIPLVALAFLVVSMVGLKTLEKHPRIMKEAKITEDGIQVTIHLENHSRKKIERMEVKDFVPSVMKASEFKVNEPVVAKTENGTRLEWEIEDMQAGESRALVYIIEPDFEGEADVHLPEAEMSSEQTGISISEKVNLESVKGD